MKLFNQIGALASMAMIAASAFLLWKHGLSWRSACSFFAVSVAAFCLCVALQVFALRRRIDALERIARQGA